MINFVERKFVIYVGKQTINAILFEKDQKPKPFVPCTLDSTETQSFFNTGKLDDTYLNALLSAIMSFVDIYEYNREEISIYITSEFSSDLNENNKIRLKSKIFNATGVHAFILTYELESLYIKNLIPSCNENRLIVRITSTSTNLYFVSNTREMVTRKLEGIGTSKIFSLIKNLRHNINKRLSNEEINHFINKICIEIKKQLNLDNHLLSEYKIALYLGGEIDFLKALNYELEENTLFDDSEHPFMLLHSSFSQQSREKVLNKSQRFLESDSIQLSPKWKIGMKPCTLIAMALFEILEIDTIIPSNLKEFYGMHYKNFENVVITGSKRVNGVEISEWIQYFEKVGVNVYSPQTNSNEESQILNEAEHLIAINKCDTVIACNSNDSGYLGDSTLFDIGYAMAKGKRVITTKKPYQDVFNLVAVEIGIY